MSVEVAILLVFFALIGGLGIGLAFGVGVAIKNGWREGK